MIYLNDIPLTAFLKYFDHETISANGKYKPVTKALKCLWYIHSTSKTNTLLINNKNTTIPIRNIVTFNGSNIQEIETVTLNNTEYGKVNNIIETQSLDFTIYGQGNDGSVMQPSGVYTDLNETISLVTKQSDAYCNPIYAQYNIESFRYTPFKYCMKTLKHITPEISKNGNYRINDIYTKGYINSNNELCQYDSLQHDTSAYTYLMAIDAKFNTGDNTVEIYDYKYIKSENGNILYSTNSKYSNTETYNTFKYVELVPTDINYYSPKDINYYIYNRDICSDINSFKQYAIYDVENEFIGILYENVKATVPDYNIIDGKLHLRMYNSEEYTDNITFDDTNSKYYDVTRLPQSEYARYINMLAPYTNIPTVLSIDNDEASVSKLLMADAYKYDLPILVDKYNSQAIYIKLKLNITKTSTVADFDISKHIDYAENFDDISQYKIDSTDTEIVVCDITDILPDIESLNNAYYSVDSYKDYVYSITKMLDYEFNRDTSTGDIYSIETDVVRDISSQNKIYTITTKKIVNIDSSVVEFYNTNIKNNSYDNIISLLKYINIDNYISYTASAILDVRGKPIDDYSKVLFLNSAMLLSSHIINNQNITRYDNDNILDPNILYKQHVYNIGIKKLYSMYCNKNSKMPINTGTEFYLNDIKYFGFKNTIRNEHLYKNVYCGKYDIDIENIHIINNINTIDIDINDITSIDTSTYLDRILDYDKYTLNIDKINDLKNKSKEKMTRTDSVIKENVIMSNKNSNNTFVKKDMNSFELAKDRFIDLYADLYNINTQIINNTSFVSLDNINSSIKNIKFYIDSYNKHYSDKLNVLSNNDNILNSVNNTYLKYQYNTKNIENNYNIFKTLLQLKINES